MVRLGRSMHLEEITIFHVPKPNPGDLPDGHLNKPLAFAILN